MDKKQATSAPHACPRAASAPGDSPQHTRHRHRPAGRGQASHPSSVMGTSAGYPVAAQPARPPRPCRGARLLPAPAAACILGGRGGGGRGAGSVNVPDAGRFPGAGAGQAGCATFHAQDVGMSGLGGRRRLPGREVASGRGGSTGRRR